MLACAVACCSHSHSRSRFAACRPLDGLQRWQMWMMLISVIASQLLVNIWMFYAKVRWPDVVNASHLF